MREPDSFGELQEWRRNEAPEWIESVIDDYKMTWEAAWSLDHADGMQAFDDWDHVRIDADGPDDWSVTFDFADGSSTTIDYGDDWGSAWDIYDLAAAADHVDEERGDVDYNDD